MNRGKKDLKPFILKAGFALILSLAGIFAAHRRRPRRRFSPPPLLIHISDLEKELGSSAGEELMHQNGEDLRKINPCPLNLPDLETKLGSFDGEEFKMQQNKEDLGKINPLPLHLSDMETEIASSPGKELQMQQNEESLPKIALFSPATMEENTLSPPDNSSKEENFSSTPLTENFEFNSSQSMAEEIKNLRNSVQFLQEREICLEMKLFEFHGLEDQENLIRELQNRLKISATETKLLFLKIQSLKNENEKLREEVSDYCRVVSEMELQKKKIEVLESKLRSVGEETKEKIKVLHGRINELREKEKKELEDCVEMEKKLKLFNELERHKSPDSVLKSQELGTLEEHNQLREENENLKKKLEQLHSDHCEDVEELVYLRWINACLRYELRNYQPLPGRTVARDLSRSLSPKSEQKAKQLILDYSNPNMNSNRSISIDFDLDDCSSHTSSEEFDVASLDSSKTKSTNSSKSKLFNKLKRLVLGKGRGEEKTTAMTTSSDSNFERKVSVSTCRVNDCRRRSFGSFSIDRSDNLGGMELNGIEKWEIKRNHSHDVQNLKKISHEEVNGGKMTERCHSDLSAVRVHKRMPSLNKNSTYRRFFEDDEEDDPEKEKLKKFAQVFRDS